MSHRVALRHFLSREQLRPLLEHVRRFFDAQKWEEADRALQEMTRKLGIRIYGDQRHILGEWIHTLSRQDKQRVEDFVQVLSNIYDEIQSGKHAVKMREAMWVDSQFELAAEDLRWIQDKFRDESDAIKHGAFTIFLTEGVSDPTEAIETLDKAVALIHPKFPQVLYGKVYVRKDLNGTTAGSYVGRTDSINLSMYATPNRGSIETLVHEFGHRYEERFLPHEKRQEFKQLYEIGDLKPVTFPKDLRQKAAEAMVARWKLQRDDPNYDWEDMPGDTLPYLHSYPRERWKLNVIPLKREFEEGKDVERQLIDAVGRLHESEVTQSTEEHPQPLYASDYGSTSYQENFAESFMHFIMHKPLPEGLQQFMASL